MRRAFFCILPYAILTIKTLKNPAFYTLLYIIDFTYLALGCYIVFEKTIRTQVGFLFNGILLTAPYINCSIENGNFFIVTDRVRDSDCFNR